MRGRVVDVIERTTIPSERGDLERERLAVEADGQPIVIERTRAEGDIGALDVEPGDRSLLSKAPGPDSKSSSTGCVNRRCCGSPSPLLPWCC